MFYSTEAYPLLIPLILVGLYLLLIPTRPCSGGYTGGKRTTNNPKLPMRSGNSKFYRKETNE